jgi:hypothetical protein
LPLSDHGAARDPTPTTPQQEKLKYNGVESYRLTSFFAACNRAELGNAAWRLFHTMFARFPDKPSADESKALEQYIYLFQRLYPW